MPYPTTAKNPASTRPAREAGFTLIEMLVLTTIIGILALLAFDAGTEVIRTAKVNSAGSEISIAFHRGRQSAITEQDRFFVTLATDSSNRVQRLGVFRDADGDRTLDESKDTLIHEIWPDQSIQLGDGRGGGGASLTDLPKIDGAFDRVYAIGFGPRGEARDPTDPDELMSSFINVTIPNAERGGWVKFVAIDISTAGGILEKMHREAV